MLLRSFQDNKFWSTSSPPVPIRAGSGRPARTLGASPTRPRQNGFVGLANGFIRAGNVILAGAGVPMFTTLNLFATANLPQARPVA